jgi:dTDP-glucose 4,6-dehydratase
MSVMKEWIVQFLITGGAGFVGSHLCDRFLADGHQVIAVDNFITGSPRNIRHLQSHPRFRFIQHDINQPLQIEEQLDGVLHLASPASPIDYLKYPVETMMVGATGTLHALELARQHKATFLLASTSEIYGDPLEHPQRESYAGNVDPIGVRACYDEAKRFGEALTMTYHRTHQVDTRIVRIFNTYGPRMRLDDGRVVPNFIGQALRGEALTVYGDGQQTRCFQYVDDLVDGLVRLFRSGYHLPVNIGTQAEMTILQFAQAVNAITGNQGGIVMKAQDRIQGDPQNRKPDTSRAQEMLNWQPRVALNEGLQHTIDYFREVI